MDTTPRRCEFCEDTYTPHHTKQKYCSYDCRDRHWHQVLSARRSAERAARREAAEQVATTH